MHSSVDIVRANSIYASSHELTFTEDRPLKQWSAVMLGQPHIPNQTSVNSRSKVVLYVEHFSDLLNSLTSKAVGNCFAADVQYCAGFIIEEQQTDEWSSSQHAPDIPRTSDNKHARNSISR